MDVKINEINKENCGNFLLPETVLSLIDFSAFIYFLLE